MQHERALFVHRCHSFAYRITLPALTNATHFQIHFRVRGRDAYLWAAKMFAYYRRQLKAEERQSPSENTSSNELLKEPSNWSLTTAWSLSSNESSEAESSPINAITEENLAEGPSTVSQMGSTQLTSDASLSCQADSVSLIVECPITPTADANMSNVSKGTDDRKEFEIVTSEVVYSSGREDSLSSSYATSTISQARTRSLSADDVNTIPIKRQRFRQQLKNLIESGIYNSLTDCTLNIAPYSAASIHEINACARDLRLSSVYALNMRDACEDGTYGINSAYGATRKQLPLCGPSLPLSITLEKRTNKCID
uniref:Aminoacyl-tRNA hydrolase n=1 Tax=Parascaris univalens TaxID=6257 RepID=A0A915BNX3_PARUN